MARDRIIDLHRRHRVAVRRSLDREQPLSPANFGDRSSLELAAQLRDPELTPAASALRNELHQRFLDALDRMDEEDREVLVMRHIEQLEEIFVGSKPIRYNRSTHILNIDMKWDADVKAGDYIIVDCYRTVDAEANADVWQDIWLKKYATALIKRQWGENLKKFEGMNLPGGVTFNGQKIWDEANEEIGKLEERINIDYGGVLQDMQN